MEGEAVALDPHVGFLAQNPPPPQRVQYTTINMAAEPPKDYFIWSLCSFFYFGNPFCLGLSALIFSIKSRDRKVVGDMDGARHYGATARCLNIIATSLVVGALVITIIAVIVTAVKTAQAVHAFSRPWN